MWIFLLRLCAIILTSWGLSQAQGGAQPAIWGKFARAYNNPFHPEDDGIIENISDEDGDNLRFGDEMVGELTESERSKILVQKKQKINGRYYDTHNASDSTYD